MRNPGSGERAGRTARLPLCYFAGEARAFTIALWLALTLTTQVSAETADTLAADAEPSYPGAENSPPDLPGFVGCPTRYVKPGSPPPRISALTESPRFEVGKGASSDAIFSNAETKTGLLRAMNCRGS
jgi:hypothetical protein